jgi:hypothetical protein
MLGACGSSPGTSGSAPGAGAQLTAVSIDMPERGTLKSMVADIETKMNGYELVIAPVDAACAGATKLDATDSYQAVKLTASLQQGCDYDLTLSLGNLAASVTTLALTDAAPSYEGKIKAILDHSCATSGCHVAGKSISDLSTYAGAKADATQVNTYVAKGLMPSSGGLPQDQRDAIAAWVAGGVLEKDVAPSTATVTTGSSSTTVSVTKLGQVYYRNNTALRIKKEDIAGKAVYSAKVALQLQADGKLIGLKLAD